jgi:SacI restriction endonuclease
MSKKKSVSGNNNELIVKDIATLESIWEEKTETYKLSEVNEKVSILLRCKSVSHRFALVTQLAGHYLNSERNLLALQKKSEVQGAWDPRSFCKKVIVPWLRNHKSPLGSSAEPYVSNPLRQKLIVQEPEGVKKSELPLWADLHQVLTEAAEDRKTATKLLHQSICILMRMIDEQDLPLKVPNRVSAASVCFVVQQFLSEGSGGDRAMAVSSAIFSVLLAPLLDIDRVERAAVNAADASTQLLADICCYDAKNGLVLAIEVKERTLTFEDVRSAIEKISKSPVGKFVFAAPLIEKVDVSKIRGITDEHFRKEKRGFHHVTVEGLLATSLMMNEEPAHANFIREVDAMLTNYNTQPENRRVWRDIVNDNC